MMNTRTSRRLVGALALGFGLLISAAPSAHAAHATAPTWVTTKGKLVTLTLIAGWKNVAGGFSFNGATKGALTITVPLGAKVNVTLSNQNMMPHSAEIIVWGKNPPPVIGWKEAFKGAHSANPTQGITMNKMQKFSFVANKAGKYMLICAVPGHATAGMWETFIVSKTAKIATIK